MHRRPGVNSVIMGLPQELEYFRLNQARLARAHAGLFVAIKDCKVIGVYDSPGRAKRETAANHAPGTFLVCQCAYAMDSYVLPLPETEAA